MAWRGGRDGVLRKKISIYANNEDGKTFGSIFFVISPLKRELYFMASNQHFGASHLSVNRISN